MQDRPLLKLSPRHDRRLRAGHPWAYSNEIAMRPELRQHPPGAPVRLESDEGWRYGTWTFNPHSLIAARMLDPDPHARIDRDWLRARIAAAAALRARVTDGPYHRLIHAEADGLPGLIVDRYGDAAVLQANTAGMDRLLDDIAAALLATVEPLRAVVARNDSASRAHEGLSQEVRLLHGTEADAASATAEEGGVRFEVDPLGGQKTGFFFDQRRNRDRVAALAADRARVLDVFCHTGAFGLRALAAGAARAIFVDSSQPALDRARATADANGLDTRAEFRRGDAFDVLADMRGGNERFDVVVCDPPAFAKSRKDQDAGLRAYQRLARLAAPLVTPGGFLFIASCSHHAPVDRFAAEVAAGIHRARRQGRILGTYGAGPDHPVHPHLPESAYLKAQLVQLD